MTQTSPPVNPPRARRSFPLFLFLALVCFILVVLVAGAVITFVTNWAVWLGAAGIALCLHWWFNVEL
jgi:hypothetical protein